jgi:nitrate/nitrite transport system substrate-binding protein
MKVAEGAYPKFTIMGKVFDPAQPQAYVDSFPMKRVA